MRYPLFIVFIYSIHTHTLYSVLLFNKDSLLRTLNDNTVHLTGHREQSNFCYFSNFAGDVPLWKIISRDLVGRFGREYACWKAQIVYFNKKYENWNLPSFPDFGSMAMFDVL
jgi:hypothetical protein